MKPFISLGNVVGERAKRWSDSEDGIFDATVTFPPGPNSNVANDVIARDGEDKKDVTQH